MTSTREHYPAGVPCFVDTTQPDVEAAKAFYGVVFGWEFDARGPGYFRVSSRLVGEASA
jgi:predicted enzyme related to lactoylglutathione lyase